MEAVEGIPAGGLPGESGERERGREERECVPTVDWWSVVFTDEEGVLSRDSVHNTDLVEEIITRPEMSNH